VTELDAEALIKEAKRLRRRRWMSAGLVVVVAAVATGLGLALSRTATGHTVSRSKGTGPATGDIASAGSIISPKIPGALAVGPSGALYVADGGRDQILRRLSDGLFQVVAGNGKSGFSGDRGQAIDAEIRGASGIAVAKNGTVYFADEGNGRVREILPDGIIETVAGGGTVPLGSKPVPALSASFGGPSSLFSLAIGPGGELYIGTSAVYRVNSSGMLVWVVGSSARDLNKGFNGIYSNPAFQIDFAPALQLAFDGKGDLLVAGGPGFGLYERTTTGRLWFLENDRSDGNLRGSLAAAPDGCVVLAGEARFHPSGSITPIAAHGLRTVLGPHNEFITGEGVAVAPNGDIYLDADAGWFSSASAIVEIGTNGHVSTLWKS
jgi:hypothetical protein